MKKIYLLLLSSFLFLQVQAQESNSTFTLGIGQDSYFGFYVSGNGTHSLSDKTSLTFYANYWANPAFGNAVTGTDFWTEVGAGVNFTLFQERLSINPSLGFTYGKVLSGGQKGVLGDGIVPALFGSFANTYTETTFGAVWFKALRTEGPTTVDYCWIWFSPGYKFTSKITAGALVEDFYLSRMSGAKATNLYLWLGPFVQYTFPKGAFLKAAAGFDAINDGFIKVNIGIPLSK
ncbi:hypothetical protein Q0590_28630 [Rhodocytophaga aerolata]|uniref:Outer membrane beta-barrel protein n=1 Tax=Rhodocytophaga aerolata TaxID=455078 RepID=A0ABT8RHK2_9BACT|nr:DUF6733 family protein [Rhodocytophaga aerolata]MDO1450280.1 hypothetical protein [Rhodocytophaga aerolata]